MAELKVEHDCSVTKTKCGFRVKLSGNWKYVSLPENLQSGYSLWKSIQTEDYTTWQHEYNKYVSIIKSYTCRPWVDVPLASFNIRKNHSCSCCPSDLLTMLHCGGKVKLANLFNQVGYPWCLLQMMKKKASTAGTQAPNQEILSLISVEEDQFDKDRKVRTMAQRKKPLKHDE